ncbi:Uma2 family endonuclease, partial [Peptococcaceae bacterium]|nr:Uma2 family endonuclease [Peptococcaceae bacterium]
NVKFTYEDYKNLPDCETRRYELLGGDLVMVPSPTVYHQHISGNLGFALMKFVHENNLGRVYYAPLDVILGAGKEWEIVQPDIFFISHERAGIITASEIQGAPDLVIEILSPATAGRDRTYKSKLYARHGTKEYWLVDPEIKIAEVFILEEKGFGLIATYEQTGILSSPLLPELKIDLKEVF